jgi:hypothetical protein
LTTWQNYNGHEYANFLNYYFYFRNINNATRSLDILPADNLCETCRSKLVQNLVPSLSVKSKFLGSGNIHGQFLWWIVQKKHCDWNVLHNLWKWYLQLLKHYKLVTLWAYHYKVVTLRPYHYKLVTLRPYHYNATRSLDILPADNLCETCRSKLVQNLVPSISVKSNFLGSGNIPGQLR